MALLQARLKGILAAFPARAKAMHGSCGASADGLSRSFLQIFLHLNKAALLVNTAPKA